MRYSCCLTFAALFMLLLLPGLSAGDGVDKRSSDITPDPDMQVELDGLFDALKVARKDGTGYDAFHERLDALHKLRREDAEKLMRQLAYNISTSEMMNSLEWLYLTSQHVQPGVRPRTVIRAMAPYLGTKDRRLQETLFVLMHPIDRNPHTELWDFTEYEGLLSSQKERNALSDQLIDYMFEKDPEEALLALTLAYKPKDKESRAAILLAQRAMTDMRWKRKYGLLRYDAVTPEGLKALSGLLEHDEWWVKRYTQEVLKQRQLLRNTMKNYTAAPPIPDGGSQAPNGADPSDAANGASSLEPTNQPTLDPESPGRSSDTKSPTTPLPAAAVAEKDGLGPLWLGAGLLCALVATGTLYLRRKRAA